MLLKLKEVTKRLWEKFLQLKRWQQVLVVIVLIAVISGSGSESTQTNTKTGKVEVSTSPTPLPEPSSTKSASPTPESSASAESAIEFRFSALRDLGDIRKDVNDARIGITQNGLGKFYWNIAEIEINFSIRNPGSKTRVCR